MKRYVPTLESNQWVTKTCSEDGNLGIDNQRKFREGVMMLEQAIDTMAAPALQHVVLTGASLKTYNLFIAQFKRRLAKDGIPYAYRGATESDKHKSLHQHFMWIVESDGHDSLFNADDYDSAISLTAAAIRRIAPSFNAYVCSAQQHDTTYIPLTADSLQNAADYLSYIFKVRSKLPGHKYMSSRTARLASNGAPSD